MMAEASGFVIDAAGWLTAARRIASPNFNARPASGMPPSLVVIHAISLPPRVFLGEGVIQLFCNQLDPTAHPYYAEVAHLRVSAHFFVRRSGALIQFVSCLDRAWHAGVSCWQGREHCNDFSIGIEMEGSDDDPFEGNQYLVLNRLLTVLRHTYPIGGVVGHQEIAPQRKTDPGPFFQWDKITE